MIDFLKLYGQIIVSAAATIYVSEKLVAAYAIYMFIYG